MFEALFALDCAIAEYVRLQRCPYCGGPLHYARFRRNPKGLFIVLPKAFMFRQGLCCGKKGCRLRTLPPSCLFMDRKVTLRCAILVFLTLWHNRVKPVFELSEILRIDVRTLHRWRAYFRDEFPGSSAWQRLRGHVKATIRNSQLPGALVMFFCQGNKQIADTIRSLLRCIEFLVAGETPIIMKIAGQEKHA